MVNTEQTVEKIISVYLKTNGSVRPHFFLTGSTGSGKTHTISKLADEFGIPMINVNSAQITNEGLAGNSISKTLSPLIDYQGQPVIVFFDEFDKAIGGENELTNGSVQNEVLKLLEDSTTEVFGAYGKYNRVSVDNVLFIFAGSFNGVEVKDVADLQNLGVIPELIGRIGLHYRVERTSLEDLQTLVERSELIDSYIDVMHGISRKEAVTAITEELEAQYDNNIIGVRLINSLIHQFFINGGFNDVLRRPAIPKNLRKAKIAFAS